MLWVENVYGRYKDFITEVTSSYSYEVLALTYGQVVELITAITKQLETNCYYVNKIVCINS